jgi:carbon monoxide dehydrogenase subunit G
MTTVVKKQHFSAPAATVWELVGDFFGLTGWMPGVARVDRNGDERTRTVTMHDGAQIVEQLLDEGAYFHHYRFDDPGPVPVRDFTARFTVTSSGPEQSEIEWTATFEPAPGVPEEVVVAGVGGLYQASLENIAAVLAG